MADNIKLVTPDGVASFPRIFTPKVDATKGTAKYQLTVLIPKTKGHTMETDPVIAGIRDAIAKAVVAKWPDPKARPKGAKLKTPLKDGNVVHDESDKPELYESYKGHWALSTSETRQPAVVGPDRVAIVNADEFYPGVICRAQVDFYGFDRPDAKGVGCGLKAVQKRADGPRLGGGGKISEAEAAAAFSDDVGSGLSDDI